MYVSSPSVSDISYETSALIERVKLLLVRNSSSCLCLSVPQLDKDFQTWKVQSYYTLGAFLDVSVVDFDS
jgi:hypothetical protein